MRCSRWGVWGLVLSTALAGCSDTLVENPPSENVLAAYVVLGPSPSGAPRAHARAIVPGGSVDCPDIVLAGGTRRSMAFREDPHRFSVRVCEALVPFGEPSKLSWNEHPLPAATMNPTRLVLFGDTGCKADDCAGASLAKPFDELAPEASSLSPRPELILHVGDYNYRGTPGEVNGDPNLLVYDAGDEQPSPQCRLDSPYVSQNAGYSDAPDSWEKWRIEFFEPAGALLSTAPFLFARGNHELCSRAGPGWFYFLDASSNLDGDSQLTCPPQGEAQPPSGDVLSHLVLTEPRIVDLGTLRVAILDSANACDDYAPPSTVDIYTDQLRTIIDGVERGATTWILTHRPFWGVKTLCPEDDAACVPKRINHTLQAALARLEAEGRSLPDDVRLLVSGHMHLFQSIGFTSTGGFHRPPQLVVGNGGVKASSGPGDGPFSIEIDDAAAVGLTSTKHGFMNIRDLAPDGTWEGDVVNPHKGETIAQCSQPLVDGGLCRPPG